MNIPKPQLWHALALIAAIFLLAAVSRLYGHSVSWLGLYGRDASSIGVIAMAFAMLALVLK